MTNGRCRLHGGLSRPPGPLHPGYRHGRYSKALDAAPIAQLYEIARQDPKLLALREDIALLVAKQQETIGRLRTGESDEAWRALADHVAELRAQWSPDQHSAEIGTTLERMAAIVAGSLGEAAVWSEYEQRAETVRKLIDTERKYEEGLRLYIPLEHANAIMNVWLDAIRRVVPAEYIAQLREELRATRAAGWPSMSPTDCVH